MRNIIFVQFVIPYQSITLRRVVEKYCRAVRLQILKNIIYETKKHQKQLISILIMPDEFVSMKNLASIKNKSGLDHYGCL